MLFPSYLFIVRISVVQKRIEVLKTFLLPQIDKRIPYCMLRDLYNDMIAVA